MRAFVAAIVVLVVLSSETSFGDGIPLRGERKTLPPLSTSLISVSDSDRNHFSTVQVHCRNAVVTLSRERLNETSENNERASFESGRSVTSKDPALIVNGSAQNVFLRNPNNRSVLVHVSIQSYPSYAPVPGGCNMEFEMKDSPFMRVHNGINLITVKAQPARGSLYGSCEKMFNLTYAFYQMYVDEAIVNNSDDEYFDELEKMLKVESIEVYGQKVSNLEKMNALRRVFSSYHGKTTIYALVVSNGYTSSAYASVFACKRFDDNNSLLTYLFASLFSIFGLILIFKGKNIEDNYVYAFGIPLVAFTFFIGINICENRSCAWYYLIVCICVLIVDLLMLKFFELKLLPGFSIGFLLATILFHIFSNASLMDYFQGYFLFYTIFIGVIMMLSYYGYETACIIVGSFYACILPDKLVGSYMRYVPINVIRSLNTSEGVYYNLPYKWTDLITVCCFATCLVIGIIFSRSSPTVAREAINYGTFPSHRDHQRI